MKYENGTLEIIQEVELEILKEVRRICEKHQITYFLDSGTALGAVRHGGFIPWDDDIDIGMPRKDYERFLKICDQELGEDYYLQTQKHDPHSPYYFAKIRKNGTEFMEWNKRNMDIHHGVYIDIFPYDHLPDDEMERNKFLKRCLKLYKLYTYRMIPDRDAPPQPGVKWKFLAIIRRVMHYATLWISPQYLKRKCDTLYTSYNHLETRYTSCCIYGFVFSQADIFPTKKIRFVDSEFSAPGNTDAYLTALYRDYMKLPDEDKRINHMPFSVKV